MKGFSGNFWMLRNRPSRLEQTVWSLCFLFHGFRLRQPISFSICRMGALRSTTQSLCNSGPKSPPKLGTGKIKGLSTQRSWGH